MNKQQPTNSVRHNDAFSQGLMSSYTRWMGGEGFQGSTLPEESIPSLEKKETKDDFSQKDPKAKAGAPDPATNLRAGLGVKQSHGAEIRDTTKVVAREGYDKKKKCPECGGKGCSHCGGDGYHSMKKEALSFELNGVEYVFEEETLEEGSLKQARKNVGASTCWKGYKAKGTKMKNGKSVPNCVKEYFEKGKDGKMVKKHNCAKKVKKEGLEYDVVPGEHTMLEDGTVTHYDIVRENEILHNVPVEELEIMLSEYHEHVVNDDKNKEVLGEKKLDPVGAEDKDVDNDGDHDKSDKYLLARRKKISKIISAKGKASKK